MKADRKKSALVVPVVNVEPPHREREHQIAAELAEELATMAGWLELDDVVVRDRGTLAPALGRAIESRAQG